MVSQTCYRLTFRTLLCNTQENTALSAGRQTSIRETRLGFQRHAVAQLQHLFECWLYVILLATVNHCWLWWLRRANVFSLFCLWTHKSWKARPSSLRSLSIHMLVHSCLCWPISLLFHTKGDYRCLQELSLNHQCHRLPPPFKEPQILVPFEKKGAR